MMKVQLEINNDPQAQALLMLLQQLDFVKIEVLEDAPLPSMSPSFSDLLAHGPKFQMAGEKMVSRDWIHDRMDDAARY